MISLKINDIRPTTCAVSLNYNLSLVKNSTTEIEQLDGTEKEKKTITSDPERHFINYLIDMLIYSCLVRIFPKYMKKKLFLRKYEHFTPCTHKDWWSPDDLSENPRFFQDLVPLPYLFGQISGSTSDPFWPRLSRVFQLIRLADKAGSLPCYFS